MTGLSRRGGAVADPFAAGPGSVGKDDQYAAVGPTLTTTETAPEGNGIANPYATLATPNGTPNRTTPSPAGTRSTARHLDTAKAPTDLDGHTRIKDYQPGRGTAEPAAFADPLRESAPATAAAPAAWSGSTPASPPQPARSTGRANPIDLDAITAKLTQGLAELEVIKANHALSNDSSSELARQTELREVAAAEVAKVLEAQNTEVERVISVVCAEVNAGLDLITTGMTQVRKGLTELGKVNGVQGQAQTMISDLQERLDAAIAD